MPAVTTTQSAVTFQQLSTIHYSLQDKQVHSQMCSEVNITLPHLGLNLCVQRNLLSRKCSTFDSAYSLFSSSIANAQICHKVEKDTIEIPWV